MYSSSPLIKVLLKISTLLKNGSNGSRQGSRTRFILPLMGAFAVVTKGLPIA